MILTELKTISRRLLRQKVFLGINIIGLTIGFVFAILAFLFAQNEFKYDKHFTNTDNAYLMACNNGRNKLMHYGQPAVFMDAILKDIPEVETGIRLTWGDENLNIDNTRFKAEDFIYADSGFFSFFGWELVIGIPSEVIAAPFSIAISESMASQLYQDENPIGKTINVGNEYDYTVTGVFKNLPEHSHIKTDFIASLSSKTTVSPSFFTEWGWHGAGVYLKLSSNSELKETQQKISELWNSKSEDLSCVGPHIQTKLQAFNQIYLKSGRIVGGTSPIDLVNGFAAIAAFILIISCLNFINLSISIQNKRNTENGIKKVLGANYATFSRQILLEISAYLIMALLFSYLIIGLSLPSINNIIDKDLSLSIFKNSSLFVFVFLLTVFVLSLCSSLPLIQMLKANTLGLLKGNTFRLAQKEKGIKAQQNVRNALIVTQFAIGIVVVICAVIVNNQLLFIRQHDAGLNKEHVLVIENYEGDNSSRYIVLSNNLKQYSEIKSITCGSNVPFQGIGNWGGPAVVGDDMNRMDGCGFVSVDYNYLDVIGAKFIAGRNFKVGIVSDENKIIITEALAKTLNLENPIGMKLNDLWDNEAREIIGVVKDIEFNTIHQKSLPVVFFCQREDKIGFHHQIMIKLESTNLSETLKLINNNWKDVSTDYPMNYAFLDSYFNENYAKEIQTASILNLMTVVAILLCCLGLFGLALFNIDNRIKEIGIRKVNGAKLLEIIQLLNASFTKWVMIGFFIASPVAYILMHRWLQNFAYKTPISWWIFLFAGLITLLIALITVGFQTWRAARRNPVESLRYE